MGAADWEDDVILAESDAVLQASKRHFRDSISTTSFITIAGRASRPVTLPTLPLG